jgi:enoyl-CoA hydratase
VTPPVRFEVEDRVGLLTIDRPEVRNALNGEVRRLLHEHTEEAGAREDVDVVILTGTDPAFCAGVDLKEAASGAQSAADAEAEIRGDYRGPLPPIAKPIIGAINGVAVTGGLELVLACDFLIASDRARFADTHARVGVMPGWGLTVLLPQAIGVRRAREMSTTGNYIDAQQAYDWGLVNHVVRHEELLTFCRGLAADIVSNDQEGVRYLLQTYRQVTDTTAAEGWTIEADRSVNWSGGWDPEEIARRREGVVARGRAQQQ